mmetsp:Transcript_49349/g.124067  ORF Transcript_49349/g.124067 Transcript_49349/m.124067 type:complete len:201 (+) Transcript_49349:228-830(+)
MMGSRMTATSVMLYTMTPTTLLSAKALFTLRVRKATMQRPPACRPSHTNRVSVKASPCSSESQYLTASLYSTLSKSSFKPSLVTGVPTPVHTAQITMVTRQNPAMEAPTCHMGMTLIFNDLAPMNRRKMRTNLTMRVASTMVMASADSHRRATQMPSSGSAMKRKIAAWPNKPPNPMVTSVRGVAARMTGVRQKMPTTAR